MLFRFTILCLALFLTCDAKNDLHEFKKSVLNASVVNTKKFQSVLKQASYESSLLRNLQEIAISAAKQDSRKHKQTPIQPILCTVFINIDFAFSKGILNNNIRYLRRHCEWGIIAYRQSSSIEDTLNKHTRRHGTKLAFYISPDARQPDSAVSRPTFRDLNYSHIPKPLLYLELLPYLSNYKYVWLLDEDISFAGFDMAQYLSILTCAQHPHRPIIAQPVIAENSQVFPHLNKKMWLGSADIIAVPSQYVEQQVPTLDTAFFEWYLRYVVSPLRPVTEVLGSDWGNDHTWCAAAAAYATVAYGWSESRLGSASGSSADRSHSCLIVTALAVHHRRSKALRYRARLSEFFALGLHMEDIMTHHFASWRTYFGRETVETDSAIRVLPSNCVVE